MEETVTGGPLAEARYHWGDAYDIGPAPDGDGYQAVRRDGNGTVTAGTPGELAKAMEADYRACPVRRDDTPARADGEDAVAAWLEANPGAQAWQDRDGSWRGAFPVDEVRLLQSGRCGSPEELAVALLVLEAACAEVRLIEAEHPGWLARRWADGTWRGTRPHGENDVPESVSAPDARGLREAIRAAAGTVPS